MRFRGGFPLVAVLLLMGSSAMADQINGSATGLASPNTILTFDGGSGLADRVVVSSYFGVNFTGFGWDNGDLGQAGSIGFSGGDLVNGFFGWPTDTTMTIAFNATVTGAAFAAVDQNSSFTFQAYRGGANGTLVDTLTAAVAGTPGSGYIGFNNESFDTIVITRNGASDSSGLSIDNLQIIGPINLGVCCSSPAPDTSGGPGPGPGSGTGSNGFTYPDPAVVPEPSTMVLCGFGIIALVFKHTRS